VTGLFVIGGLYVLLIVAMLAANAMFTTPGHLLRALDSREIRYAIKLSLISCAITAILSVWVAVPLGYVLSRYRFRGKGLVDAIVDIPVVLPPLVIGLSLLILFQTPPGRAIETFTERYLGVAVTYFLLPSGLGLGLLILQKSFEKPGPSRRSIFKGAAPLLLAGLVLILLSTRVGAPFLASEESLGKAITAFVQSHLATPITYAIPSVILAQFAVACAFAVRTMRVTFDQMTPRQEQVAQTLGCSRSQAFWLVVLPEARRGIMTAGTIAWARSLGEFGPLLVFAGATRLKTEVLSTTVFLELSVGNLESAVAVSLLMVIAAVVVLVVVREFGMEKGKHP
jgi:molybdate transport system permease protein